MIILHDAQKQVVKSKERFRVLLAGRRFGKSILAVEELIFNALTKKKARVCYIAPTYQSARDIAWDILKNRLKDVPVKINDSRLEIELNDSKILLRSWENIDTLRGQYFDFIVMDEVAQYKNFWLNWQEVLRPTLTDRKGRVLFISTPLGFNHFYDLYNKEGYAKFHFTSYDNPHIPQEEIDKAKEELPEDRFAQEYMADFRKTEGLVYKEFSRERHISESEPKKTTEIILGIDFGYTNPASIIPIKIDGDNHYWIKEEWYKSKQTTEQISEQALLYKSTKCYPDPAEPDRIEILKKAGLNCREVSKDIVAGVDHIRELFKQGRIHIHPECKNLIMELETYRYPDKKPDQNEPEKPIKENDHCLVGNTKISMANGRYKLLKNIKVGDIVKSKNGNNKVLLSKLTRIKADIVEVEFSNGSILKGTKDHKIYTKRGKIAIDDLRYSDIIEVLTTKKILLWKKQSNLIIRDIIGTVNIIAQLADIRTAEKDYIRLCGKNKTEKFQKDFIYTTRIEIERTTRSAILNLSKLENIYRNIIKETGIKKSLEKKLEIISTLSDRLRRYGIHHQRVLCGTANTEKNRGKLEKNLKKFAKYVEKDIKLIFLTEVDFAIRIVRRRNCGKEDVYNITVENDHNYFANGILVKNCLDALRYALYTNKPEVVPTPDPYFEQHGTYFVDI